VPSPGRLGAALLAIPVAGILHVIGRDLYDGYRGRLGELPPRAAPNTMPPALTSSSLAPECCPGAQAERIYATHHLDGPRL
jgi:hypothetical protein